MTIQKYSLIELIHEKKYDYVEDVIDGKLKLTGRAELIVNNPEILREVFPDDLPTEKLMAVCAQLKLLKEIYANEIRRRVTDVQRNKSKSKYFNDNFS